MYPIKKGSKKLSIKLVTKLGLKKTFQSSQNKKENSFTVGHHGWVFKFPAGSRNNIWEFNAFVNCSPQKAPNNFYRLTVIFQAFSKIFTRRNFGENDAMLVVWHHEKNMS